MIKPYVRKNKAMNKLAGDPLAEGKRWISSSGSLSTEISSLSQHQSKRVLIGSFLLTITLSAAVALIHMSIVQAGYDWGYLLVERIWGELDGAEQFAQGLWALTSLGIVIAPGVFGFAYGACCSHVSGKSKVWTLAPYLILATLIAGFMMFISFGVQSPDSDTLWGILVEGVISLVCLSIGLRLGAWVYSNLKSRVQAARMFIWSLVALLPFAIFTSCGQMSLSAEIVGYFLSIMSGSCIAGCVAKSKDRTAAVIAALFAMLPIVLANFLNLSSSAFSWLGDSADWRALASASALNIVALAAICAGGTLAVYLRQKNRRTFKEAVEFLE